MLSWVANHDCHICVIVAFCSSSMITGCFMVGEHVNILKKQSCEHSDMTNHAYQTRQRIVSNITLLLQKWWFVWFISLSSSENVHFSKNNYWAKWKRILWQNCCSNEALNCCFQKKNWNPSFRRSMASSGMMQLIGGGTLIVDRQKKRILCWY